jgi:hypothetical protein
MMLGKSIVRFEDDPTAAQAFYEDPKTDKLFYQEHLK